jgi:drug/metabolite transporter (DMT)-like permease
LGGSFRLDNIRVRLCVWYATLKRLTATRASIVQVLVPILAALGGVLFLPEIVTIQMLFSCVLVLGGIAMEVK